ncbi:hypothetical protein SAMN05421796_101408 [Chryseobacterium piscicola]|uniref:Uncharacterized protein n=1 Tax=Chryseobacterium piscicola TaxID=551459 RepID=A0A1N7KA78_9FLAO|nr:STM3941 family protein [Chryseobacterium piscicola]PQA96422.1 hypothetical protein B0A70_04715 [Chryseobacterium piscicola]SIS58384.1 hypothetical protein SAMN05421796_101408 [Chryseobacterium piscicola]
MSDIIFKKNKRKYFFIIILLVILIFFTLYFSILFLLNPSKYVYALMPNKTIVLLIGILGLLGCLILVYITTKSVFNKEFSIIINKDGLFIGIIQYSNKNIMWEDIKSIETISINNIKHIIIYINHVEKYENYEKGIQNFFLKNRVQRYGTPFVINTSALQDNVEDIAKLMNEYLIKFRRNKG